MPRRNTDPVPRIGIAVLAKAPIAGLAKTRLISDLGAEGAAALQAWLLQRTVRTALAAGVGPVSLWCTPDSRHAAFQACRELGQVDLYRQPDGDLGQRMHVAIAESPTPDGTLVIGTDCPVLTPTLLRQAAAALAGHEASLIPAEDGGYVLIGLCRAAPQVFADVAWSSERVLDQTRARLREVGWRWAEFAPLWDVDRSNDLEHLATMFPERPWLSRQPATA